MKAKNPLLLFGLLVSSYPLQAAENDLYVGIQGGTNRVRPQYLTQASIDFVKMNFHKSLNNAYVYGAAIGWNSPSNLRPELEFSYRKNNLKGFSDRYYEGNTSSSGTGSESFLGGFANLWYDIPLGNTATTLYLGGGIGYGRLRIKNLAVNNTRFGQTHDDNVFAWQLGAGIAAKVSDHYTVSVDYRYMRTRKANYGLIENLPQQNVSTRYQADSVMLGVRYNF